MPSPRKVQVFTRAEFIDGRRWRYLPGEHVSVIGPTGWGKTHLQLGLLAATATPELPGIVLAMKPRDSTVRDWARESGFRTVRSWPPAPPVFPWQRGWGGRLAGWVLWPRHTFDPDKDDPAHYALFRKAMLDSYKRGKRILFADEAYSLSTELGLTRELITIWTKGRSMSCGLWSATQRPTHVPLWMYSQAHHLFLGNDPDEKARDRFKEIGGIDPQLVKSIVSELPKYHWLYIRRDGPRLCVIAP